MTDCVNCEVRPAVYRVADPGADRADFCGVDLPPHLQERAEAGEFNLLVPIPMSMWVARGHVWIEVLRTPDGYLVPADEEREQQGHHHGGENQLLVEQPLTRDEHVALWPVGHAPVGAHQHEEH